MVQDEPLRQFLCLRAARRRDMVVVEHHQVEAPVTVKIGDGIGLDRRRLRSCLWRLRGPHEWDLDFAEGPDPLADAIFDDPEVGGRQPVDEAAGPIDNTDILFDVVDVDADRGGGGRPGGLRGQADEAGTAGKEQQARELPPQAQANGHVHGPYPEDAESTRSL